MTRRYRAFSGYLTELFGPRVFRVPLDAGFTCPNRDGTRSWGGCTYCDGRGSATAVVNAELSVRDQLADGIARIRKRFKARKFIAYFQAFSNTYASVEALKSLYDTALAYEEISGIVIGTRPDCLPDDVLDLLSEYSKRTFLWLELGLQSAFNETLDLVNRGHSAEEFFDAVKRARARKIKIAAHLIFGLPGETRSQMLESVRRVAACGVDGIKLHQLCIYKGTALEKDYRAGQIPLLSEQEYVGLVVDALELLPPEMIIMRLMAEGPRKELVAPDWTIDKQRTLKLIDAEMERRDCRQGSKYALSYLQS